MAFVVYNKETGKQFPTKYATQEEMKNAVLETFGSADSIPEALAWKQVDTPDELKVAETEATQKARAEAIPQWQKNLMPYSTKEAIETGDSPLLSMTTLKDAFSLPGRFLATGFDQNFDQMSKTSEEYDGMGGKILTSPVTGATVLAAPFAPVIGGAALKVLPKGVQTAKYALPLATGVTEGLMATGAGASMDDTYGAGSAAFDIGTSMAVPFAGPLLRAGAQNLTKSSIKQMLIAQGIEATDDVVNEVFDKFYGANSFFKSNKTIGKDMANKNLSMLLSDMEPGSFLSTSHGLPEIIGDIQVSLGKNSHVGAKRTLAEADRDIARVKEFYRKQEMLKEGLDRPGYAGFFEPGEYEQHMTDLIGEYSDIPELMDVVKGSLSRGKATDRELIDYVSDYNRNSVTPKADAPTKSRVATVPPKKIDTRTPSADEFNFSFTKEGKKVPVTGARGVVADQINKLLALTDKVYRTGTATKAEVKEAEAIIDGLGDIPITESIGKAVMDWDKAIQNLQIGRTMQNKPLRPVGRMSWEYPITSATKAGANVIGSPLITYPGAAAIDAATLQMPQWLRSIQGDEKPDQGYNLSQLR